MEAWFDTQDVNGRQVVFFHLRKPAITQPSNDFVFDGPATEGHMKDYSAAWKKFQKSLQPVTVETEMQAAPVSFEDKLGGLING